MGNRALRKKAGELLREHGGFNSRLYRGKGRDYMDADYLHGIIERLEAVKNKTVVHDCDGHNHRVAAISPYPLKNLQRECGLKRNFSGYWLAFPDQFLFEDGRVGCGCNIRFDQAVSRAEIEAYWLSWPPEEVSNWKFLKAGALEHIRSGGHCHDEDGVLLPEWRNETS